MASTLIDRFVSTETKILLNKLKAFDYDEVHEFAELALTGNFPFIEKLLVRNALRRYTIRLTRQMILKTLGRGNTNV